MQWHKRHSSMSYWEDPLGEGMATHSRILAWRIPWTEEPGGLQVMGSQRVRHDLWLNNNNGPSLLLQLTPGRCPGGTDTRPPYTLRSRHIHDFSSPLKKKKKNQYTVTHFKLSTQTTLGKVNCPLTHVFSLCSDRRTRSHGFCPLGQINRIHCYK